MTQSADLPHETGLLLVLRRVRGGRVVVSGPDTFREDVEPFPAELVPFLHELFAHGQVRLEEQSGSAPPQVVMTTAGEDLLAELDEEGTPDE